MGIVVAAFCITFIRLGVMEQDIYPSLSNYDGTERDKQHVHKV